jgi:hypothetical protein
MVLLGEIDRPAQGQPVLPGAKGDILGPRRFSATSCRRFSITCCSSLASTGYAMVYASLIIILGFALLAFSGFVPSVLFGLLSSLAMTMTLVFDLALLPALLVRFGRQPGKTRSGTGVGDYN